MSTDTASLRAYAESLRVSLDCWGLRTEPDAHARRCANDAMDALDSIVKCAYEIRSALHAEIRAADDATAARVDAMLAERITP